MTGSADWQGRVGDVWAQEWRRTDRAFANLSPHLNAAILAAAPTGIFAALDIGCGAGGTSIALADARADAQILGIDLSEALVAVAVDRAPGHPNPRFHAGDVLGEAVGHAPIDLFFSRHGVMFFDDPVAAFAALHAAARRGAAFVFSCFDAAVRNRWSSLVTPPVPLATGYRPGPFAFADPAQIESLLSAAGWRHPTPTHVEFDYIVGHGTDPVADAVSFLTRIGPAAAAIREAGPDASASLVSRLTDAVEAARIGDTVAFPAAAWLWSAQA